MIKSLPRLLTAMCLMGPAWPAWGLSLVIRDKSSAVVSYELPTASPGSSAGFVTVDGFTSHSIPFAGSEAGITAIFGQGSELEVITDTTMKAWGWCFAIDGKISDKMPDQVPMPTDAKILRWFYAYALYDSGQWTGYCIED